MALEKVMKGNDVRMRTFTVTDGMPVVDYPKGTPISLDLIEDYKINAYRKNENNQKINVAVFRKTPKGDNLQAIAVDVDGGVIGFIVPRTKTFGCPVGIMYAEIEVLLPDQENYIDAKAKFGDDQFTDDDGNQRRYEVCEIVESSNAVVTI